MRISYNKLWKMLIDKNMKKSDLKEKAGISHFLPLLNKNESLPNWKKSCRCANG